MKAVAFYKRCLAVIAGGILMATPLFVTAQEAASIDELLKMIEQAKVRESQEHRQREQEFRQNKNEQQQLLQQAQNTRDEEEARSSRLEEAFAENEREIDALEVQLDERLGGLKEMFGHLTSTAGDVRSNLNRSIVSAQYPGRTEFLDDLIAKMNSDTKLPKMSEIEQLWSEMTREMAESAKVVKFPGTVVTAEGEKEDREIVRIGVYNLLSNGAYLDYNPGTGMITELARQPSGHTDGAAELQQATEGFTAVGIDPTGPTGGDLLKALIDTPSLVERWHQGGVVGYIITAVGVFAALLAIWRIVMLSGISARVSSQLKNPTEPNENNPLGRVLKIGKDNPGMDAESLELKLHEAVIKERPGIEAGLNLLKVIAMVAPLLGLLGTVTGMIVTFQQITIFGAGDHQAMAGGISQALVTTVLGLTVAIPTVLLHTLVNGRAQGVLQVLEEQSAGLIAENTEGGNSIRQSS